MLASTEGRLIKVAAESESRHRLTVESGSQLFTCVLDGDPMPAATMPDLGATIRCTGVLALEQGGVALDVGSFALLMTSHKDVQVLIPAPWWTPRHLTYLFGLLIIAGWIAYRVHLRNVRARMNMILEERSRIAREIHDTLAQGFAGIALQLQGLDRAIHDRSSDTSVQLNMALQMVRRSRAEAHRSIATLRTLHSSRDLAPMAENLLKQLTRPAGLELLVEEVGSIRAFSDETTTQILRILQEAVANILEHAQATRIALRFQYAASEFSFTITDNGIGFDPQAAESVGSGHFGITGMLERAAQIGAQLSIHSGSEGTQLKLWLSLPPERGFADRFRLRRRHTQQASGIDKRSGPTRA